MRCETIFDWTGRRQDSDCSECNDFHDVDFFFEEGWGGGEVMLRSSLSHIQTLSVKTIRAYFQNLISAGGSEPRGNYSTSPNKTKARDCESKLLPIGAHASARAEQSHRLERGEKEMKNSKASFQRTGLAASQVLLMAGELCQLQHVAEG